MASRNLNIGTMGAVSINTAKGGCVSASRVDASSRRSGNVTAFLPSRGNDVGQTSRGACPAARPHRSMVCSSVLVSAAYIPDLPALGDTHGVQREDPWPRISQSLARPPRTHRNYQANVAGMSGIWKGYSYRKPYPKCLPFIRSFYQISSIVTQTAEGRTSESDMTT